MGSGRAQTPRAHQDLKSSFNHKNTQNHAGKRRQTFSKRDQSVTDLPGLQKLKASLRQTRRLLERDNLAADVRTGTERRLRSLESDLRAAELIRKERAFAKRYHKVKFFERQKVLRKMKKVQRELDQGKAVPSKGTADHLANMLFELRIQLNYIQNYPKLEKYISLFPPSKEKSEQNPDLGDTSQPSRSETDARREQLLREIEARMAAGELSGEPERDIESRDRGFTSAGRAGKLHTGQRPGKGGAPPPPPGTKGQSEAPRNQRTKGIEHSKTECVDGDDFFETASSFSSDSAPDFHAASDGSNDVGESG